MKTEYTVHVNKAGTSYTIDFDALPVVSKEFLVDYGLKQKLNDTVNDPKYKGDEEASQTEIERVIAALREGTITVRQSGPRADQERIVALEMIVTRLLEAGKAKNKTQAKAQAVTVFEAQESDARKMAKDEIKRRAKSSLEIRFPLDVS